MTPLSLVLVNGEDCSHIQVGNRGFEFGDGLFETMLAVKGRIPLLEIHLRRLQWGCEVLELALDLDNIRRALCAILDASLKRSIERAKVRVTVVREQGSDGSYAGSLGGPSDYVVKLEQISVRGKLAKELLSADIPLPRMPAIAGIKHLSRLPYIVASNNIKGGPHQEVMFVDGENNIVETMHYNIIGFDGNSLLTPTLIDCGVHGLCVSYSSKNYRPWLRFPLFFKIFPEQN